MKHHRKKRGRPVYGSDPVERSVVEVIMIKVKKAEDDNRKVSPWLIARQLNEEGYRTQTGRPWDGNQVKRIIAREKKEKPPRQQSDPKVRLNAHDYLTAQQIAKCRLECPREDLMLLDFMLATGLRAAEVCSLKIGHLGITGGKSQVDVYNGKGSKDRSVEIDEDFAAEIRKWLEKTRPGAGEDEAVFLNSSNEPLRYKSLYDRIKKIGRRAGLEDESKSKTWLHPHALRHTCGTHLYDQEHDPYFVQRQLGHKSVETTQIYAHTPDTAAKRQVRGLWSRITGENTSKDTHD